MAVLEEWKSGWYWGWNRPYLNRTCTRTRIQSLHSNANHISTLKIKQQFLSLHFVVQDISPHQLSQEQGAAIEDLQGRVTFQQHNFFDPEPVHDANAFLLRQCLHNYNDSDCIKILSAVIPALEKCNPKTPLLINDIIMPESGTTTRFEEHHLRQVDMTMLVALGSKQRTEREFKALLEEADARFTVCPCGSRKNKPHPANYDLAREHKYQ